ncbi:right-handed parallel beta-helix repeat-containing protein [Geothrix limicola]|uniref:right-handed parallel beta-helix repeat-containing protein n=1 Tax=Geothrix limicola TaxID=2927978 RepID=UPI002557422A|nr:right-handed parallel beta-helix repeat-containing protein [Geothrix limicola]
MAALDAWAAAPGATFYVSTEGSDAWTGRLPAPNRDHTDGPFASVSRARDAIRALKAGPGPSGPLTVQIRGGQYFLERPLSFGVEDSGTAQGPVSYEAYRGEHPEFIGGRRLVPPASSPGAPVVFSLPETGAGPWAFRSLFVDGRREVRARYPNVEAADPRKAFLYVKPAPDQLSFGVSVGGIHHPGDWLEYRVQVPADGDYLLWLHYGALNAPYGVTAMDGRTWVQVDGQRTFPLGDLADTGGWSPARWAKAARIRLSAGTHLLRWQNQKGGGLVLDALVLCDDAAWMPQGTMTAAPEKGHRVVLPARAFARSHGRQITVNGAGSGPRNAIWCARDEVHPAWLEAPDAEVHVFQSGDSRAFSEILSIRGYDPAEGRLLLGGPEAHSALNPGDRYYIENVKEELDAPGEWFLDARARSLTYLPRSSFSARSEVIVPMTTRLIQVEGGRSAETPVHHLRFSGLTFRDTDWVRGGASAGYGMGDDGAILFANAEACAVEDCRFLNLGAYAVCLDQGRRNTVRGCDVAHAGGGGVLIRGGRDNQITDNHLHHLGEAYQHVGGIVLEGVGASGNDVSHNAIHDTSRYGISLKEPGEKNVIAFNRIQNTNLETYDSGGIEVTQHDRAFRSGSAIRNNLVADTIGFSSIFGEPIYMSWGIYLDSFASGYEVSGNVVCRTWNGGVMLQGGKENRVTNNVFVDGQVSQGTIANYQGQSSGLKVNANILAFSSPEAVAFDTGTLGPGVLQMDRNLYFPPGGVPPVFTSPGAERFSEWQGLGRDAASLVADPRFRMAKGDDYALRPGSPAFRLGFKALPLDQVGPRTRACTCSIRPAGPAFWGTPRPSLKRLAKNTRD